MGGDVAAGERADEDAQRLVGEVQTGGPGRKTPARKVLAGGGGERRRDAPVCTNLLYANSMSSSLRSALFFSVANCTAAALPLPSAS